MRFIVGEVFGETCGRWFVLDTRHSDAFVAKFETSDDAEAYAEWRNVTSTPSDATSLFGFPVQTNPHIPTGTVILMREGNVLDVVDVMNENTRLRRALSDAWVREDRTPTITIHEMGQ